MKPGGARHELAYRHLVAQTAAGFGGGRIDLAARDTATPAVTIADVAPALVDVVLVHAVVAVVVQAVAGLGLAADPRTRTAGAQPRQRHEEQREALSAER
jgi:hypothetical protein